MVEAELERVAPLPESEAFDKSCLMMLDDELLRNPWQAMTSLCWESVDEPVARRPVPRLSYRNKIADVPADTAQSGDFNLGEVRSEPVLHAFDRADTAVLCTGQAITVFK